MVDIIGIVPNKTERPALRRELLAMADRVSTACREKDTSAATSERQALREFLETHPGVWKEAGDLVHCAEMTLCSSLKSSCLTYESVLRGQKELRADLGYEAASPLERLLIDVVALYHLRWSLAEFLLASVTAAGKQDEQEVNRLTRRANETQGRYLHACESLARVRKLARRTPDLLQINIAAQQTNIADAACLPE